MDFLNILGINACTSHIKSFKKGNWSWKFKLITETDYFSMKVKSTYKWVCIPQGLFVLFSCRSDKYQICQIRHHDMTIYDKVVYYYVNFDPKICLTNHLFFTVSIFVLYVQREHTIIFWQDLVLFNNNDRYCSHV